MKKLGLFLGLIILSSQILSPLSAQENLPFFTHIQIGIGSMYSYATATSDNAFALTQTGELYYWGKSPVNPNDITRTPQKFAKNVVDYNYAWYITKDGKVYNQNKKCIAEGVTAIGHYYVPNNYVNNYIFRGDKLYVLSVDEKNDPHETFIKDGVKDIKSISVNYANGDKTTFLNKDGTLYTESKDENGGLVDRDVQAFNVTYSGVFERNDHYDHYFYIKNDATLWYSMYYSTYGFSEPVKILDNIEKVASYSRNFLALTKDGTLYEGHVHSEYEYLPIKENDYSDVLRNADGSVKTSSTIEKQVVMEDVVDADINNFDSKVAIKKDGTIWCWGWVIGQPEEHITTTPGKPVGETQVKPMQLSLVNAENEAVVQERMQEYLRSLNEQTRSYYLGNHYDYYAEKYPQCFTDTELAEYKQYSQKAKEEIPSSLPDVGKSESNSSLSSNSNINENSSLPIQNSQDQEEKIDLLPIIVGITVLLILLFMFLYIKKRR